MKTPFSWLKSYVDIDLDIKDFCEAMTMSGSKVEKIHHMGADITNVVVGRIEEIVKHPDADKLVVTQINIGEAENKQIVTGATNVNVGDYVPVALHGANLAGDLKIKKGKIRGEASDGMLCSVEELGYTRSDFPEAPEDGIYIFEEPQTLGMDARVALGILEDVIEFEITSNRADCYSVIGLAREAAATLGVALKVCEPKVELKTVDAVEGIGVEIASENCNRYIAAVVKNVKIAPSPQWLRSRLMAVGIRPINNIVDITNYVMLEYGQPMHAFDIRAVEGGKIVVRDGAEGEKITTLDEIERKLDADTLVIADGVKAIGIAGIMGGDASKINDDTTTVLFESANFNGPNIRQSSKKLGLRTDSSGKFEKGLDPNMSITCIKRALELVAELGCGDVAGEIVDAYPMPIAAHNIEIPHGRHPVLDTGSPYGDGLREIADQVRNDNPNRISSLLGVNITIDEISKLLAPLGVTITGNVATIPTWRRDLNLWQDIAEEVARLYGYDNIPAVVISSTNAGGKTTSQKMEDLAVSTMTALGYSQMLSYAFESPKVFDKLLLSDKCRFRKTVNIINPLGEDTSIMRTVQVNGLLASLATNYNRRNPQARLFEIIKTYTPAENTTDLPMETRWLVAGGFGGDIDFYDAKGVVEAITRAFGVEDKAIFAPYAVMPFMHGGRTASASLSDIELGYCGQLHPQVMKNYDIGATPYLVVINFDLLCENAQLDKVYKALPKYPAAQRDIALVVKDEVLHGELVEAIKRAGQKILKDVQLFDVYKGKGVDDGFKSMAYNLTFRADDRTLTDEEITKSIDKILLAAKEGFDAVLRG
ncbi:MAG: phenylalanine--tRNA ligase subunit beta [Defluviitaleaceae bacterium]|nr:phenylalanine--tRNA ligase subunit beta [Defluviitaleaceae bacterium]